MTPKALNFSSISALLKEHSRENKKLEYQSSELYPTEYPMSAVLQQS